MIKCENIIFESIPFLHCLLHYYCIYHIVFLYNIGIKYKELEEREKPFEYIELRKQFIAEICNYNPSFGDKKTEEVLLYQVKGDDSNG